jgi:OFA family oxalate/formate antiporter-like MFS transporter
MTGVAGSARVSTGNRWVIAAASCFFQLALGTVYASSVLLRPVMEEFSVSKTVATLAFTLSILALGVTAGFGGAFQRRFGPRAIATTSGLLYGGGVCLAGLAPNIATFYLGFGLIGGIGLGLGYIVPVAMLLRWFPDKRGLISGLAVAGFGSGALVVSPVATRLLDAVGLDETLIVLGLAYFLVIVASAQFFRAAPEGYAPEGWVAPAAETRRGVQHLTLREAMRSSNWYLLWLILALNVTAGTALVSVAAPLAQSFCDVDATTAALIVGAISITNGLGRPFWGWASDKIGRPATFLILFAIQVFAFRALGQVADFGMLLVLAAVIGMCLGAGFAAMPAFVADFFGSKHAGAIYGAMLTAWSAGAVAGPLMMTSLDYRSAASAIAWLMLFSVPLPLVVAARGSLATLLADMSAGLRNGAERLAELLLPAGLARPARELAPVVVRDKE